MIYPRLLTKEEMIEWVEESVLPFRLMATMASEDTIILTRIDLGGVE